MDIIYANLPEFTRQQGVMILIGVIVLVTMLINKLFSGK